MLHTVNKSPFIFKNFESCARVAKAEDPIMLYEDGVYAAMKGTAVEALMKEMIAKHPVFAIRADVKARGIVEKILEGVKLCDYDCFVDLVTQHKIYAWL